MLERRGTGGNRNFEGVHLRDLRGRSDGIGGFFEAIVALMVITIGVVFITFTLPFVANEVEEMDAGGRMERACEDLMAQFLGDGDIFSADGMLDLSAVGSLTGKDYHIDGGVAGFKVIVTDPSSLDVSFVVVEKGKIPHDPERLFSMTMPVNLRISDSEVRACIAAIWAW